MPGTTERVAAELCDGLQSNGASVWFSERDVPLGTLLIREIDKGLKNSRVGIVLVTPALLKSIESEGIAEKELSVLLSTGRVIPVAHGTTFEALREVSPCWRRMRTGNTADSSLADVAAKVAAAAAALGRLTRADPPPARVPGGVPVAHPVAQLLDLIGSTWLDLLDLFSALSWKDDTAHYPASLYVVREL